MVYISITTAFRYTGVKATWPITGEYYMVCTLWLSLSNSALQKGLGWAFYDNPHNAQTE